MQAKKQNKARLKKAALFLGVILLWQLVFYITTDVLRIWKPYMFPNPLGVLETFVALIANGTLGLAVLASLRRVLIGYFLSIVIGACLGLLIYRSKLLNEILRPIFLGLQTLPSICWLPFAILWFGLSEQAILFVIVIGSSFSVAIAVEAGFQNVNPAFIKAGKTMGATKGKLFTSIIVPASLPQVAAGLKQGWSFAWRALMNGEMLYATIGLGRVLALGRDLSDINQVMCVMIVITVLGILIDRVIFGSMERYMQKNRGQGARGNE